MKTIALLAIMIIFASALQAQTRVVHGRLTTFNEFPVENVEVTSKKAKATTVTDEFGHFSIVCLENDVIKVKPKAFNPVRGLVLVLASASHWTEGKPMEWRRKDPIPGVEHSVPTGGTIPWKDFLAWFSRR